MKPNKSMTPQYGFRPRRTSRSVFFWMAALLFIATAFAAKGKGKAGGVVSDGKDHIALGEVSQIDTAKKTFQIDGIVYRMADNCTFLAGGHKKGGSLSEYKEGDAVTLTYHEEKGERIATIVGEQGGKATGKGKKKKKAE